MEGTPTVLLTVVSGRTDLPCTGQQPDTTKQSGPATGTHCGPPSNVTS